eukprot:gene4036-8034_t
MISMLFTTVALGVTIRCMVGLWGYSGYAKPTMYGDFEAQRHWMEITTALPIGDWYRNTTDNNLLYWGLDYPPLTAYTSWIFGKIAEVFYPALVELNTSRGHESLTGKFFMRYSVIICDLIVKCIMKRNILEAFLHLCKVGIAVIGTFFTLWLPFCLYASENETGLFEDKVSNIWYTLSVIVDPREYLEVPQLVQMSMILTIILLLPTIYEICRRPLSPMRFLIALCNCSLAFFLASFQVHEKSLLLVLAPAALLLADDLITYAWLQVLGLFTLFPLLLKDGLLVPYFVIIILFVVLVSFLYEITPSNKLAPRETSFYSDSLVKMKFYYNLRMIFIALSTIVEPPTRYPDLYPALFSIFGAISEDELVKYLP